MIKVMFDNNIQLVIFNGCLYLAKDRRYSEQYIGNGNTINEAIVNMEKTIKKCNLKQRNTLYK